LPFCKREGIIGTAEIWEEADASGWMIELQGHPDDSANSVRRSAVGVIHNPNNHLQQQMVRLGQPGKFKRVHWHRRETPDGFGGPAVFRVNP
jgi:hypothetical protein